MLHRLRAYLALDLPDLGVLVPVLLCFHIRREGTVTFQMLEEDIPHPLGVLPAKAQTYQPAAHVVLLVFWLLALGHYPHRSLGGGKRYQC